MCHSIINSRQTIPERFRFKSKQCSRATYPTRSWSAYPAPVHLCIASLLHRLISYQWWQVHPQSQCQQQGCLPWCLPCCVLMWLQCMQRTWHFLHKPCTTRPRLLSCEWHQWLPRHGAAARQPQGGGQTAQLAGSKTARHEPAAGAADEAPK